MAQTQEKVSFINVQDYLEGEKTSEIRHEYEDGEVYAMSGGTKNHNKIAHNISSDIESELGDDPCDVFINDVRLRVQTLENESYYYPDVVVTCDPEDNDEQHVDKPKTIVEVLSESTEKRDKHEKFFAYRSIESLDEYVLVSQQRKEVIVARKSNNWKPELLSGDDFELNLSCVSQPLTSARVYRNVKFSE